MTNSEKNILSVFLPRGVLDWFDVGEGSIDDNEVRIVLEEKNLPPIPADYEGEPIISKGFKDITITDFPIRGRRALLTFRRRFWQVAGRKELLKRDIPLTFEGTQLEQEFARFLKDDGGRSSGLTLFYRRVATPPRKRI